MMENGTDIVYVTVYDDFADWETAHLMARVQNPVWQREPGRFVVRTVGGTAAPVRSMGGLTVTPDVTVDEVATAHAAMLVLPGSALWEGDGIDWALGLARAFRADDVPVAAICGATFGLAAGGLLDGHRHTSAAKQYLELTGYAGADDYVEADVVDDAGLITAGPVDGLPFARAALARLGVFTPEVLQAWWQVFTEHDAEAFGVLAAAGSR